MRYKSVIIFSCSGVLCLALISIFVYEPERGANEAVMTEATKSKSKEDQVPEKAGKYSDDLKALATK